MCLGVPGRVVQWVDRDPTFARATVEFDGVCRECHMACVLEAEPGDFVIVHAGIAICKLDTSEAAHTLDELRRLGLVEPWSES